VETEAEFTEEFDATEGTIKEVLRKILNKGTCPGLPSGLSTTKPSRIKPDTVLREGDRKELKAAAEQQTHTEVFFGQARAV